MESNLFDFKKKAFRLGLCNAYKSKWDSCISKRDLIKLGMSINGMEFLADSIAFKWGISKEYIVKEYTEFISNTERHPIAEDGYTSEMYVMLNGGHVEPHATANLMVGCCCSIKLYKGFVGEVHVCGGSNVTIDASESKYLRLVVYGKDCKAAISDKGNGEILRENVLRSKWV